jgi:hypothetical protein
MPDNVTSPLYPPWNPDSVSTENAPITGQPQPPASPSLIAGLSGQLPQAPPQADPEPHKTIARAVLAALGGSNATPGSFARSMVAGALTGLAAPTPSTPGAGFLSGLGGGSFAEAQAQKQAQARQDQLNQQKTENAQKQQTLDREDQTAKAQNAFYAMQTKTGIERGQREDVEFGQHQADLANKYWEDVSTVLGPEMTKQLRSQALTDASQLTPEHATQIANGTHTPIYNGETHVPGEEDKAGAVFMPTRYDSLKLPSETTIISDYAMDDKGNIVPTKSTFPPGMDLGTEKSIYFSAQKKLHDLQDQKSKKEAAEKTQTEIASKQQEMDINKKKLPGELAKAQGEANEANAKANKTNREASQIGAPADAAGTSGEAFIATLNPSDAATVRAIGQGRQTLPGRASKEGLRISGLVNQAFPDWDQSKGSTWTKTRNEYMGSGKTATQVVPAYNTALEHMQDLYNNTTGEGIFNPLSKAYQDREVALGYVSREVGKAVSAGAMTQKESEDLLGTLKGGLTPSLKRERITKTAQLLHDKIDEYQTKFQQSAPSQAINVPTLISPKAASSYDFIQSGGTSQQQPQKRQAGLPQKGDVKQYNGSNYVFDGNQYVRQQVSQ